MSVRLALALYRMNPSDENQKRLRQAVYTEFERLAQEQGITLQ